ncbi:long-chain-fatty-acid--CoA ligase [Duganella sp. HH101]|nr:AMP-binding protein [Duganella sp. HH101]OEZ95367.1 long-chain-fatty-acid--CoA ligase [Duganella sp. HH101]
MDNLETAALPAAPDWWRERALLRRVVADLMHTELCLMRHGSAGMPGLPWPERIELDAELGIDSLERYALASALAAALHLPPQTDLQPLLGAVTLGQWCDALGEAIGAGSGLISFKSSGSSGVPTRSTHRLDLLWQEARFFAAQLPQARRLLYAVPSHHIYGFLFTVLLPLAYRPAPALVDLRRMLPAALRQQAEDGDVVVAYPELWAALAQAVPRWRAGAAGVTSTAPCPPALARQLADGGLRLLEVYGSSETAGVGWRSDADAPYALLPYWRHAAGGDVLQRPAADDGLLEVRCPDRIDWRDGRRFVPDGRRDHAVQVAGVNVYPAQVAALLARHPAVRAAHVRLMRPDEGARLKAFVVPLRPGDTAAPGARAPSRPADRPAPPYRPAAAAPRRP